MVCESWCQNNQKNIRYCEIRSRINLKIRHRCLHETWVFPLCQQRSSQLCQCSLCVESWGSFSRVESDLRVSAQLPYTSILSHWNSPRCSPGTPINSPVECGSLVGPVWELATLCSVSGNSGHLKWTRCWHPSWGQPSTTSCVLHGWLFQGDPRHERGPTSPYPMPKRVEHSQNSSVNIL